MKVIVVVVSLAMVAFVAADKVIQKNGLECRCHTKTCDDDISCEEYNCLCLLRKLKKLENECNRYPKSWVLAYRKLVEKKCRCLKKCEKRCTDDDIEYCTERAHDRFICGYTDLAAEVLSSCKKGQAEALLEDFGKIGAECLKQDCKPQCTGDSDCDPFLNEAEVDCIKNAIEETKKELRDHEARALAVQLGRVLEEDARGKAYCANKHSCPIARKGCLSTLGQKSDSALAGIKGSIRAQMGHCTGNNLIYGVSERVVICSLKGVR